MPRAAKRIAGIRAVSFDAGNTLLRAWPPVAQRYSLTAARYNVAVSPDDIKDRFVPLWRAYEDERRKLMFRTDREGTRAFWHEFVAAVFEPWMALFADFDVFFEELYRVFSDPLAWELYDDVLPALQGLAARNLKLAVISNWDYRLRGILSGLAVSSFFHVVVISAEVGVEKPAPAIFEIALGKLGLKAGQVLHIGDSLTDDVYGAKGAGMYAAQIDRIESLPARASHAAGLSDETRLDSLTDIFSLLD
jgi:putative hydrolase of the HAD superfamily